MKVAFVTRAIDKGAGNLTPILRAFPESVEWKVFSSPVDIEAATLLLRHRRELEGYDIVHVNTTLYGAIDPVHKPIVCSVHTIQRTEFDHDPSFKNRIGVEFEKATIRHADRFLTVSPSISDDLLKNYPGVGEDRVRFVRHAVLDPDISFVKGKRYGILASGRLVKRKNFPLFIECARDLPGFNFTLVGEGGEKRRLQRQRRGLPNFALYPYLLRRHYVSRLSHAFVYVMTSLYEGYPTTVFEAMAAGTPVISTPIPAVIDMICDETGMYFDRPGDFAESVKFLKDNPDVYEGIQDRARAYAESQPSAETIAREFVNVYEELL